MGFLDLTSYFIKILLSFFTLSTLSTIPYPIIRNTYCNKKEFSPPVLPPFPLSNKLTQLKVRHNIRRLQIPHMRRLLKPKRSLNQRRLTKLPAHERDPERKVRGKRHKRVAAVDYHACISGIKPEWHLFCVKITFPESAIQDLRRTHCDDRIAGDGGEARRAAAGHDENVKVVLIESAKLSSNASSDQVIISRGQILGRRRCQIVSFSSQPGSHVAVRVILGGECFREGDEILQAVDVVWVISERVEVLGNPRFELDTKDERAVLRMVLGQIGEVGVVNNGSAVGLEDRYGGVESIDFRVVGCASCESIARYSDAEAFQCIMLAIVLKFISCFEWDSRCIVVVGILSCNCREKISSIPNGACYRLARIVSWEEVTWIWIVLHQRYPEC
jgi:hypothetical protein